MTSRALLCGLMFLATAPQPAQADDPALSEQAARDALAATISRLIEGAIPLEYDKQMDWGATREITSGLRTEGKGFHTRLVKRKRAVDHGVWKHYKLRLLDPETNLRVRLTALNQTPEGPVTFSLAAEAKLDAWARAKIYQYGVHLGAYELESDMRVRLAIDGDIRLAVQNDGSATSVAVLVNVAAARLDIDDFHLRRVSNADGPLVRELGDGVRKLVEEELNGPRLVEKLNRAIEKKRDRLAFRPAELWDASWWPLDE